MTRQQFYNIDPPTGFPAIEECACGSVLDQLLQQQCYQIDNKKIFQPFDNAYVTARVDTDWARVPAPIELNMPLQRRNQPVLLVGVSQRSGQGSQVETQADTRQLLEKSQGQYFPQLYTTCENALGTFTNFR